MTSFRALDYLRDAGLQPDARIGHAVHVVESRQQADGRWLLDRRHEEALAFPFGESVGEPSRWNTLRALRVLRWYERARLEPTSPILEVAACTKERPESPTHTK